MWLPLLLHNWVNCFHCRHMWYQLLILNFYEIIFPHLYFFINFFIVDTNTWLCISFFCLSDQCVKWTFGLNIGMRKVWIYYNIITVWCILIILLSTVHVWVNSSKSRLLINVQNIPSLFPSWRRKHRNYLFYFCKIFPQYNQN